MESGWDPFGSGRPKNGSTEGWVDLTLGETSNRAHRSAEQEIQDDREERVSKSVPSSSVSTSTSAPAADAAASKRSRVYNKAPQNVKCLVDDCDCDLRSCRDYHRRHRVCEVHSKTAVVSVKGKPQRFCQQCSRFHSLEEFDDFKRSCRRRLDGHNKRRRKPHPPPLYFASDYAGPRLLQYGAPAHDLYGNVNPYLSMWPVSHITGAEHTTFNRFTPILPKIDPQTLLGPFANIQHPQEKQIPIMQPDMNELAEPSGLGMSVYEPLPGTSTVPAPQATSIATETASEDSCHKVPSDCALYLLSALQGHNSEYNYASMNCNVQFSAGKCLCSGSAIEEAIAPSLTLDANMNTVNNLPYNGMSRMGQEYGLMGNGGSSLTFPFSFQ